MKTSPRDQVLMMILPAILIVFMYAMGPMVTTAAQKINPHAQLTQLEKRLTDVRATAPSPAMLTVMRMNASQLGAKVNELERAKQALEQEWRELQPGQKLPRSQLALQLGAMFNRHKLTTLSHAITETNASADLPASLRTALAALQSDKSNKSKGRLLRLEIQGEYTNLLNALKELAETDQPAIPVSLVMEEARLTGKQRRWSLVLLL